MKKEIETYLESKGFGPHITPDGFIFISVYSRNMEGGKHIFVYQNENDDYHIDYGYCFDDTASPNESFTQKQMVEQLDCLCSEFA